MRAPFLRTMRACSLARCSCSMLETGARFDWSSSYGVLVPAGSEAKPTRGRLRAVFLLRPTCLTPHLSALRAGCKRADTTLPACQAILSQAASLGTRSRQGPTLRALACCMSGRREACAQKVRALSWITSCCIVQQHARHATASAPALGSCGAKRARASAAGCPASASAACWPSPMLDPRQPRVSFAQRRLRDGS
jgi:hypothetical protein